MLVGMLVLLTLGLGFGSVFFPRTVAQTSTQTTSRLYQLEFVQVSSCPYGEWKLPWGVVLDNNTVEVQPSNAPVPLTWDGDSNYTVSGPYRNYTTISFSVPNGTYNYSILPTSPFGDTNQSGSVTVKGSDIQVEVSQFTPVMLCTTSTTTEAYTSSTTATTTVVSTYTSTSISTTTNSAALYGVAAVAVVFIIATGYLAMRGRNPAS
jgi:hypothetical protein